MSSNDVARHTPGLARDPTFSRHWREAAAPISAAVFMLLVLAATSLIVMSQREAQRETQREARVATEPSPTDLILLGLFGAFSDDTWRGEQYPVVWIKPAGDEKPILPPGVPRLPKPGQAVVSPALDRLASHEPALAARYPHRLVLGSEGIRSENELLAYVRVPKDRPVPQAAFASNYSGDNAVRVNAVRVSGFGPSTDAEARVPLSFLKPPVSVAQKTAGFFGFLIVPSLTVLVIGVAIASSGTLNHRRFRSASWLVTPERTPTILWILTAAAPGLVATTVFWAAISPRLNQVPLVGHGVVRGDLGLPWWLLLAELGACALVSGLVAFLVTSFRRRRGTRRSRATSRRGIVAPLRFAPLAFAAVALAFGGIVGGDLGGMLQLVGMVATVVGVPLILPTAVREVGAALGRMEPILVSAVGREMEREPFRTTWPFNAMACLLVFAFVASGFIVLSGDPDDPPPSIGETQPVFVDWLASQPSDPARLSDALGSGLVAPFEEGGNTHGHEQGEQNGHAHEHAAGGGHAPGHAQKDGMHGTLLLGATCQQLAPHFPGTACSTNAPFKLPAGTEQTLAQTLAPVIHDPGAEVNLAPVNDIDVGGSAVVFDDARLQNLDERARIAAMQTLVAPSVRSSLSLSVNRFQFSPAWVAGGFRVALIAFAVGGVILFLDRFMRTREHRLSRLAKSSSPSRKLVALEAWHFVASYGTIVFTSSSIGITACALTIASSAGVPMPWLELGIVLGVAIVIGLAGGFGILFLNRVTQRNW